MADQSIKINIGTTYSGAGMQKAMSATKQLGDVSKRAAGAIGQLGSAFGGMDGQIGKAVNAIAGFASTIAVAGPIGLAITAITSLVSMFKFLSDEAENAKKAQEKLFAENLNKGIDNYGKNLDKVIDKLGKLQAQQEKVAKSTVDLNNAMTDKNVAQRQLDAINEAADVSSGERGVIQAKANIDIARMKGESAVSSADANVNVAQGKLNTTTAALGQVGDEIRALTLRLETLNSLNRAYHDTSHSEGYQNQTTVYKAHQAQVAVNKAQKKLAELQERQANLIQTQEAQRNELAAAEQKAQTARINADAENAKAQTALKDAEDKAWEEEQKAREAELKEVWDDVATRVEARNKRIDEANAEKKLKQAIEKSTELEKKEQKAKKELEQAQLEYVEAVKKAEAAAIAAANASGANYTFRPNDGKGDTGGSGGDPNFVNTGINGTNRYGGYTPHYNGDGSMTDRDKARESRMQEGIARNAQNASMGANDRRDYRGLLDKIKRGTPLDDNELERFKKYRNMDPEVLKEKAEAAMKAAEEQLEEKKKQAMTDAMKKALNESEIMTLLEKLGLK